jgi:hypothetical protein
MPTFPYSYTGPGGSSAGSSVGRSAIVVQATNPRYSTRNCAPVARASAPADVFVILNGSTTDPVDLTGKSLRFVVYEITDAGDECDPFDDQLTAAFKYETGGDGITLGGEDSNEVTVQHDATKTATAGDYRYFLWNVTDQIVLSTGKLPIVPALFNT